MAEVTLLFIAIFIPAFQTHNWANVTDLNYNSDVNRRVLGKIQFTAVLVRYRNLVRLLQYGP
ncbi:hypothetical protein SHDE107825_05655 [Shewanella denitrificans]